MNYACILKRSDGCTLVYTTASLESALSWLRAHPGATLWTTSEAVAP